TLYEKLLPILNCLEDTGKFAQASKAALNMSGKKVGLTRSPLMPLNSGEEQHLKELLSQIKSN
ncbi:MAG: dihydrodipicolinate synthase family protein, partial [Nitrososphaerales archaeon]